MSLHTAVNERDQQQGNRSAPIVLVEYGDYECPHCGAAYPMVKKLQAHFKDNLLFVFRNFPLTEMHPHALTAASTAEAAGLQGKFWEVHDLIFEHQQHLDNQHLLAYAQTAGVDMEKLKEDIASQDLLDKIENDIESGVRSGVNGTPTFFINGQRYNGYYDYDVLKDALQQLQ